MSKLLAIFGATGNQGSSVINHILSSPSLSTTYSLRAITRNPTSQAAQHLNARGVDVVAGDLSAPASLASALSGAHTVFLMNAPVFGSGGYDAEYSLITAAADAAVAAGVKFLIFSTLPSIKELSKGKYTALTPFDAKAAAEKYIRKLPIASSFVAGAFFFENFHAQQAFAGIRKVEGKEDEYVLQRPSRPEAKMQYIDAGADFGKYVGAILERPDRYEGEVLYAAQGAYSFEECVEVLSRVTGKKVRYEQLGVEEFGETVNVPEWEMKELVMGLLRMQGEMDLFGEDTEEKVKWGREQVGERLGTMEEYFQRVPFVLP